VRRQFAVCSRLFGCATRKKLCKWPVHLIQFGQKDNNTRQQIEGSTDSTIYTTRQRGSIQASTIPRPGLVPVRDLHNRLRPHPMRPPNTNLPSGNNSTTRLYPDLNNTTTRLYPGLNNTTTRLYPGFNNTQTRPRTRTRPTQSTQASSHEAAQHQPALGQQLDNEALPRP